MNFGDTFRSNIRSNLTMEEQERLAALITPELAQLCAKALGPEVAEMFIPYLQDDVEAGRMSEASLAQLGRVE